MTNTAEDEWRSYEQRFASDVLARVRLCKKDRRLTAKEIADRLALAGWPLSLSSLNGMLGAKGRKSISVTEVIALARALEVTPVELLLPITTGGEVEIGPGENLHAFDAYRYFTAATRGLPEYVEDPGHWTHIPGPWDPVSVLLDAFARHASVLHSIRTSTSLWLGALRMWDEVGWKVDYTEGLLGSTRDDLRGLLERLADIRQLVRSQGAEPPAIPEALDFVDERPLRVIDAPIEGVVDEEHIAKSRAYLIKQYMK